MSISVERGRGEVKESTRTQIALLCSLFSHSDQLVLLGLVRKGRCFMADCGEAPYKNHPTA